MNIELIDATCYTCKKFFSGRLPYIGLINSDIWIHLLVKPSDDEVHAQALFIGNSFRFIRSISTRTKILSLFLVILPFDLKSRPNCLKFFLCLRHIFDFCNKEKQINIPINQRQWRSICKCKKQIKFHSPKMWQRID